MVSFLLLLKLIENCGLISTLLNGIQYEHITSDSQMDKMGIQSKLFKMSLVITEYSISDINWLGTDLFPLKFPLCNVIFTL